MAPECGRTFTPTIAYVMQEQFGAAIDKWLAYQASPRGRIRSTLLQQGVLTHAPSTPCSVLDIGGGTGELAGLLADFGHRVTLADHAQAMLDAARERLGDRVTYAQVDLGAAALPGGPHNMIVCHNVLEYVPGTKAALSRIAAALAPGGLLSLAFGNARHAPLQSAIVARDLDRARRELHSGQAESTNIFGTQTHVLEPGAVLIALRELALQPLAVYGIRCASDLLEHAYVEDAAHFDALLALERDLMLEPAYAQIGRFVQVIARKE